MYFWPNVEYFLFMETTNLRKNFSGKSFVTLTDIADIVQNFKFLLI